MIESEINNSENQNVNDERISPYTGRQVRKYNKKPKVSENENNEPLPGYSNNDLLEIGRSFVLKVSKERKNTIERDDEDTNDEPPKTEINETVPEQKKPKRRATEKQLESLKLAQQVRKEKTLEKQKLKEAEIELKNKIKEKRELLKKTTDLKTVSGKLRLEKLNEQLEKLEEQHTEMEKQIAQDLDEVKKRRIGVNKKNDEPKKHNDNEKKSVPMSRSQICALYGF